MSPENTAPQVAQHTPWRFLNVSTSAKGTSGFITMPLCMSSTQPSLRDVRKIIQVFFSSYISTYTRYIKRDRNILLPEGEFEPLIKLMLP